MIFDNSYLSFSPFDVSSNTHLNREWSIPGGWDDQVGEPV
jgi:hypothetical protein